MNKNLALLLLIISGFLISTNTLAVNQPQQKVYTAAVTIQNNTQTALVQQFISPKAQTYNNQFLYDPNPPEFIDTGLTTFKYRNYPDTAAEITYGDQAPMQTNYCQLIYSPDPSACTNPWIKSSGNIQCSVTGERNSYHKTWCDITLTITRTQQ